MKSKTKKLAVAKLDSVGRVCRSIVPPPKRSDVIRATAKAIHEERVAEHHKKLKEHGQKLQALQTECRSLCKFKVDTEVEIQLHFGNRWTPNGNVPTVEFKFDMPPEIAKRYSALESPGYCPSLENIEQELRARASDRSAVVDAMLKDPSVKEKLLQMGKAMLQALTPSEKESAIPA